MSNIIHPQQNEFKVPFWDEMIQMEKELPLATQELLYKAIKKMYALELANKFDATSFHFNLDEVTLDEMLQKIANEND